MLQSHLLFAFHESPVGLSKGPHASVQSGMKLGVMSSYSSRDKILCDSKHRMQLSTCCAGLAGVRLHLPDGQQCGWAWSQIRA